MPSITGQPTEVELLRQITQQLCCLIEAAQRPDYETVVTPPFCVDGTWHYFIVSYENGVEIGREEIDSGSACTNPPPVPPDFEKISYCNLETNTTWEKVSAFAFSGTDPSDPSQWSEVVLSDVDTGKPCHEPDYIDIPLCYKP